MRKGVIYVKERERKQLGKTLTPRDQISKTIKRIYPLGGGYTLEVGARASRWGVTYRVTLPKREKEGATSSCGVALRSGQAEVK